MKKTRTGLFFAAAMMTTLSVNAFAGSLSDAESIKIGILLSTSGDFSISETPMRNAAEMAINEINEAGGIGGVPIEPIFADYGSDPSMAAQRAEELILNDGVSAIVGTNSSSTRLAVEPIVEQYDSLLVYNTFYEGETPSPNVLYTNTVPSQQVDGFLPYITENLGTKIFFVGLIMNSPAIPFPTPNLYWKN